MIDFWNIWIHKLLNFEMVVFKSGWTLNSWILKWLKFKMVEFWNSD